MPPAKRLSPDDKQLLKLEELYQLKCETDLFFFVQQAWQHVIKPGEELVGDLWYLQVICSEIEALFKGEFTRSIINQPPRTLKSTIASICAPVWWWITHPRTEYMFSSYGLTTLTNKMSLDRRRLIESNWFQKYWSQSFRLSADENTKSRMSNDKGGAMQSASTDSGITGIGGDIIIIDDPHNTKDITSDAERNSDNTYIRESLLTRLNNRNTGRVLLVMQRLHEDDATGMLLEMGGWKHLCLPAECEQDEVIGGIERKKGSLLNTALLGEAALKEAANTLGPRGYAGQFQQRPAPKGGLIFKPEWMKYWTLKTVPNKFDIEVISVDCAFKDAKHNDQVAIHVWAFLGPDDYLLDWDTDNRGYVATKAAIRRMRGKYPNVRQVLVEDKANGSAVVEELKQEFNVIAIDPDGGKESRAQAASADFEAGHVFLPDPSINPKVLALIANLCKFPAVKRDDDVDAITQAINWRRGRRFGLLEYYKNEAAKMGNPTKPNQAPGDEEVKKNLSQTTRSLFGEHGQKAMLSESIKVMTGPKTRKCTRCNNIQLRFRDHDGKTYADCSRCGLTEELSTPIERPHEEIAPENPPATP